jgi:hypothetical protein
MPKVNEMPKIYWECQACYWMKKNSCDCHICPDCGLERGPVIDADQDEGKNYYNHDCEA